MSLLFHNTSTSHKKKAHRVGRTVLSGNDFPLLLTQLHTRMAALRDRGRLSTVDDWELIPPGSLVTTTMIDNACDPTSTRLLDWTVYDTLLDAAKTDSAEASDIRHLYRALELLKTVDPSTIDTVTMDTVTDVDTAVQPQSEQMRRLQWQLAAITTEADMIDHLNTLRTRKGWSLRKTAKKTQLHHPKVAVSSSTLSTWFGQPRLPANRAGFQALVHTLLPNHLHTPDQQPLAIYMRRYDDLRGAAELNWTTSTETSTTDTHKDTDTSTDWQALYEKSEHDRRRLATLLANAHKVIIDQNHEITHLRATAWNVGKPGGRVASRILA